MCDCNKTDKELTADIVNNYVRSWNSAQNTRAIKTEVLVDIIKTVYETISNLDQK